MATAKRAKVRTKSKPKPKPKLDPVHEELLDEHQFDLAGTIEEVLASDEHDGFRIVYAITNPEHTEVVYIGDTEIGRNLRGRLRAHMKDRGKIGLVENDSHVYVHIMITELLVLHHFEQDTGRLPALNKRKVGKFV